MFVYTSPTHVWYKPSINQLYNYNENYQLENRSTLTTSQSIYFQISRYQSEKKLDWSTQLLTQIYPNFQTTIKHPI
jgi:hypothetical protein